MFLCTKCICEQIFSTKTIYTYTIPIRRTPIINIIYNIVCQNIFKTGEINCYYLF